MPCFELERDANGGAVMRPDKPGCWWWEDSNGRFHVIEFDSDMEAFEYRGTEDEDFVSPSKFEREDDFKRWLGPAHPPKKVKVYYENLVVGGCWDAQDKYKIVMYGDVEEFLIGDDNETE